LTDVRGFARHVANIDPKTQVPPAGILPGLKRAKPYVYSDAEIDALLAAALALPPEDGLRRWTYHCLFGLIAATGMRLSEAIGLQREDVDLDTGVLTVRQSKFGKSRLVPLHPTTRAALRSYAERRDAHLGSRCGPHFFVAERGGRLLHQYVHRVFWRLSREIGLRRPGDRTGPRVHDFRHRFAIRTLLSWYREGTDVEKKLPALSTYLGHTCVRDTYWYLSACPQLMQEAARRLDRRWEPSHEAELQYRHAHRAILHRAAHASARCQRQHHRILQGHVPAVAHVRTGATPQAPVMRHSSARS
jgi:integrase